LSYFVFKEESGINLQHRSKLVQPTRPDSVCALFILLDLLKRQPERVCDIRLAHAECDPARTQATPDLRIYRVRHSLRI
jgi:hypothetical protein